MSSQAKEPEPQEQKSAPQKPKEQETNEQGNTNHGILPAFNIFIIVFGLFILVVGLLISNMKDKEQFNAWVLFFALVSAACSCGSQGYEMFVGNKHSVSALIAYSGACIAATAAVLKVIALFCV